MTTKPVATAPTFGKKLILSVTDSSEFFDTADYVVIELAADRINRIRSLAAVVRDLAVYRISEFNYDCQFMIIDYEVDPEQGRITLKKFAGRTECPTLNVTDHACYWSGYYKHTSVRWETASVPLTVFAEEGDYDLREVVDLETLTGGSAADLPEIISDVTGLAPHL